MTSYNGNQIVLYIDGVNMGGKFKSVNLDQSMDTEEVTAGSGVEWISRAPKLRSNSISIGLAYDVDGIHDYIQYLRAGEHNVVFGPEGSAAGKPKHEQVFDFTSAPFEVSHDKSEVMFEVSGDSAGAPVSDIFNGDTF